MRVWAFIFTVLISGACWADDGVSIDLAKSRIDVTTGFVGETLVVYGYKRGKGQVVLTLSGPERRIVVRRKSRLLGAWFNRSRSVFQSAPGFYHYAVDPGNEDIRAEDFMIKIKGEQDDAFKGALIRTMQMKGLYPQAPAAIQYFNDHFFKAEFYVPSNVPLGVYRVRADYIEEGQIVSNVGTQLEVGQIGFLAGIYRFSVHYEILYGLVCIFIAVGAGWVSNRLRGHI